MIEGGFPNQGLLEDLGGPCAPVDLPLLQSKPERTWILMAHNIVPTYRIPWLPSLWPYNQKH